MNFTATLTIGTVMTLFSTVSLGAHFPNGPPTVAEIFLTTP